MNKKLTDYVIDLVEILNKQQKTSVLGDIRYSEYGGFHHRILYLVLWPYKSCACGLRDLHSFSLPPLSNHDCVWGAKC